MSQVTDFPPVARGATTPAAPGGPGVGRALRWGWPVVLLVAAAAVAASLYTTSRQVPEYTASARLQVSPLSQTDSSLFATGLIRDAGEPSTTVNTTAVLVESNLAAQATAERVGRGLTMRDVLDAVAVTPVEGTSIIEVEATLEDPTLPAPVATEFARSAIRLQKAAVVPELKRRLKQVSAQREQVPEDDYSQRDRLFNELTLIRNTLGAGDPTLRFVQSAAPPVAAERRSRAVDAGLALVGGLLLGLAAIVGIDRLRRPTRPKDRY